MENFRIDFSNQLSGLNYTKFQKVQPKKADDVKEDFGINLSDGLTKTSYSDLNLIPRQGGFFKELPLEFPAPPGPPEKEFKPEIKKQSGTPKFITLLEEETPFKAFGEKISDKKITYTSSENLLSFNQGNFNNLPLTFSPIALLDESPTFSMQLTGLNKSNNLSAFESKVTESDPRVKANPLIDLFSIDEKGVAVLEKRADKLEEKAMEMGKFKASFPVNGTIQDMEKFLGEWENKDLTSGQRTMIMKKFMGLGKEGFAKAAGFYEKSAGTDETFSKLEIPKEYYIVCLNKTNRLGESIKFATDHLDSLVKQEVSREDMLSKDRRTLYRDLGVNGEVLGGLGKAFKVISQKAQKGQVDPELVKLVEHETGGKIISDMGELSRKALEVSRDYYLSGFGVDCEFYPGINAVYNNLLLGDINGAEKLAPMVKYACEREGGKNSVDYWCLVTQMELSLIMKDKKNAVEFLPLVLKNASPDSYLDSTADNLEMLSRLRKEKGEDTKELDFVSSKLRERLQIGFPPPSDWNKDEWITKSTKDLADISAIDLKKLQEESSTSEDSKKQALTKEIIDNTFSFKDINSKFVGGNWSFGGIIPDIPVNRESVKLARNVLEHLGLKGETDFNVWNSRVEYYLQNRLGLIDETVPKGVQPGEVNKIMLPDRQRVLEDLHSPQHKRMDDFRNNLLKYTHSKESGDSRTDIMVELGLGTVDCRQTAYSKQLLYDVWKRDSQTHLLQNALDALQSGDHKEYEKLMAIVDRMEKEQLVTVTATIKAPVKMNGMYNTCTDAQGRPLPSQDGKIEEVENHTFNVRLFFDDNRQIKNMESRDCFYKGLYPLGHKKLNPEDMMDKKLGFMGGEMGILNSEGKKIPFWMTVTKYSGAKPKTTTDECGVIRLGGMEIEAPNDGTFIRDRSYVQHIVDAIAGMDIK